MGCLIRPNCNEDFNDLFTTSDNFLIKTLIKYFKYQINQ